MLAQVIIFTIEGIGYYVFTFGVIMRSLFSYVYINIVSSIMLANCTERIIDKPVSLYHINYVTEYVQVHRNIREGINRTLGFIPFATLSLTFIYCCFHITFIVTGNSDKNWHQWYNFCEFVISVFINMSMVMILGMQDNDNDSYVKILFWLNQKKTSYEYDQNLSQAKLLLSNLIQSLHNNVIQHDAWGMFLIDKKFLLVFLGSLIPFCVMIIQFYQTNSDNNQTD
jgi:hypothetical protein